MDKKDLGLDYRQQFAKEYKKQTEAEEEPTVTAIRFNGLGEFYYDKKYRTIDWRSEVGEEISLTPVTWAVLAEKIPVMLKKLGADD